MIIIPGAEFLKGHIQKPFIKQTVYQEVTYVSMKNLVPGQWSKGNPHYAFVIVIYYCQ